MAAATSSYSSSCRWTREWKRRKVDEGNSSAIQQHHHHPLPGGVITEILVRLPAKSILRFKSVCKSWRSLIRSRYLVDFHRCHRLELQHQNDNRLFFYWLGKPSFHDLSTDSLSESPAPVFEVGALLKAVKRLDRDQILKSLPSFPLFFKNWEQIAEVLELNIKVLGPLSNGIYAVVSENSFSIWNVRLHYGYCSVALCNPATGDYKILPSVAFSGHVSHYGFSSIIHKARAGGVEAVLDYKTVVVTQLVDFSYKAFVYSQRHGPGCGWKCIDHSDIWKGATSPKITPELDLDFLPQAVVNGCCHWAVGRCSVLQFDFAKEVFGLIPGPPLPHYGDAPHTMRRGVFLIHGRLAAITLRVNRSHDTHYVDVWVMKEYGVAESWTRIHSSAIRFEAALTKFLGMFLSRNGEAVERLFFQLKMGIVVSYDCSACTLSEHTTPDSSPSRWTTKKHDGYDGSWACWKTIGLASYVETLEPVDLECNDDECTI